MPNALLATSAATSATDLEVVDDHALGAELTELYHDANDGFRRVLRFGARFLQVEKIVSSTRGGNSPARGPGSYGFDSWLRDHAPDISAPTARRYRDVTEALARKYKIADPVLCFSSPASELPADEAQKQHKALDFVAEKSIRQVQLELDLIDPPKIGGARTKTKKLTPAQEQAAWVEASTRRAVLAFSSLHSLGDLWKLLPDSQVRQAIDDSAAFVKAAKAWIDTPPPNRIALDVAAILDGGTQS